MRILRWAALAALAVSGAASAQLAGGRSGISSGERLEHINAYRELQLLGICFARTQRPAALAVIATTPGSREERQVLDRRFFGERGTCAHGGTNMRMSTVHARGAIAEGLFKSGGVPPEYRLPAPAPTEVRDLLGAGLCFAASHRAEAQALLETQAGSEEETAAVTALWEDFRTCIPGFRIRLNAIWIRYILAEGLLRLAPANPAPPAN